MKYGHEKMRIVIGSSIMDMESRVNEVLATDAGWYLHGHIVQDLKGGFYYQTLVKDYNRSYDRGPM